MQSSPTSRRTESPISVPLSCKASVGQSTASGLGEFDQSNFAFLCGGSLYEELLLSSPSKETSHHVPVLIELVISDIDLVRLAYVVPGGPSQSSIDNNNICYLPPQLYFNISKDITPAWSKPQISVKKSGRKISVAESVNLKLVKSPLYSCQTLWESAVYHHFQIPRILCNNDVIAINSLDEINTKTSSTTKSAFCNHRYPVIYFKVEGIAQSGCVLVDSRSKLTISGYANDFIPRAVEYLSGNPLMSSIVLSADDDDSDEHPTMFSSNIDKLQRIVEPFIVNSDRKRKWPLNKPLSVLVTGVTGVGKTLVVESVAARLNMHFFEVNCCVPHPTSKRIQQIFQTAREFRPCILYLRNINCIGKKIDTDNEDTRTCSAYELALSFLISPEESGHTSSSVFVVGSCVSAATVSPRILSSFLFDINIELPNDAERCEMLHHLFRGVQLDKDVRFHSLIRPTIGMTLGDIQNLVSKSKLISFSHRRKQGSVNGDVTNMYEALSVSNNSSILKVNMSHITEALEQIQTDTSDCVGTPRIPQVNWSDVGGLIEAKSDIIDTIQLPLEVPELFSSGFRRSGILLYGPPGCGKTLLAKAVATECSLNFTSVKGPELINKYVGQSEENVRDVFLRAQEAAPCVIFFDELDSLAPNRGRSGDSGGVMDRVVSQLLAELDGLHSCHDVFVIGATNRPDLIDPALLRPGRFDKMVYIGVSRDHTSRLYILKSLTRKFILNDDVDLSEVERNCPPTLTGADFYALTSDAMMNCLKRKIDQKQKGIECDDVLDVEMSDFQKAVLNIQPSVSVEELNMYERLQDDFKLS